MSQHQLDEFQQIMQFMQSHGPAFLQQSGHPGQPNYVAKLFLNPGHNAHPQAGHPGGTMLET